MSNNQLNSSTSSNTSSSSSASSSSTWNSSSSASTYPHATSTPPEHYELQAALNFMEVVKSRYSNNVQVYQQFTGFMTQIPSTNDLAMTTIIDRVSSLLSDSPDLFEWFKTFLHPKYRNYHPHPPRF